MKTIVWDVAVQPVRILCVRLYKCIVHLEVWSCDRVSQKCRCNENMLLCYIVCVIVLQSQLYKLQLFVTLGW